eukprot:m.11606 g.11606  ORF g.11606 m.11606 type:complete len:149 (-) comp5751_c0_seq2:506-952(-)
MERNRVAAVVVHLATMTPPPAVSHLRGNANDDQRNTESRSIRSLSTLVAPTYEPSAEPDPSTSRLMFTLMQNTTPASTNFLGTSTRSTFSNSNFYFATPTWRHGTPSQSLSVTCLKLQLVAEHHPDSTLQLLLHTNTRPTNTHERTVH